jgi:hypothetical protein
MYQITYTNKFIFMKAGIILSDRMKSGTNSMEHSPSRDADYTQLTMELSAFY